MSTEHDEQRWVIWKQVGEWDDVIEGPDAGHANGPGVEVVPAHLLAGAVEERDAAYRQRDRYYLALRLAVGEEAVGEYLARADAKRGQ